MRICRLIGIAYRVVRNPWAYFNVLHSRAVGSILVIKAYRKWWLPLVVFRTRHKKRLNVVFLAMNPEMWRYDGVYRKFMADNRFNPIIVTAMRSGTNMDVQLKEQDLMASYFSSRGFKVVLGYDVRAGTWIDLRKLRPDIIFYTQPYDKIIAKPFEFFNHLNVLHCYAPYSFQLSEVNWNWNNTLQQYCWKIFYVGVFQVSQCKRWSRIGDVNAVPAGYCFEEEYSDCIKNQNLSDGAWRNDKRKRIIWAPHHSIKESEWFKVSSFLEVADLMVRLRDEYKDNIVFAFKPHPALKIKLYDVWGRERTDAYYDDWAKSDASFDAQGDYHALFAGSDAMIHCSGSFIVEYLYTGKPVAYVYSKTRNPPDIGPVGNAALDAHYPMHNESDIRRFIDAVVLGGDDTMGGARKKVADMYLKSSNGKMFSENVYESILEGLGKR